MSYVWKKDGKAQQSSSGFGKNFLLVKNSYLDTENKIEVAVSDVTSNINTSGKITLLTSDPKIVFYTNDPMFGIRYERALNNGFSLAGSIFVAPYFFSPKDLSSNNLKFTWSINGETIATPNPKNILAIKPESGVSGSAKIKVDISNTKTLFQESAKEINVNF